MLTPPVTFIFVSPIADWLHRVGGLGLIVVGIADNSVIPLPGSMDVLTIWLAASHPQRWFLYAILAVLGSLIGGYLTYYLARRGGKEAFEKRLGKRRSEKIYRRFERWGFWAVAVPALLPPPFPIVPFLLASGALQYSRRKFLMALAVGRSARFFIVAGLGAVYGNWIVGFFAQYYKPAILVLVSCSLVGVLAGYIQYRRLKSSG